MKRNALIPVLLLAALLTASCGDSTDQLAVNDTAADTTTPVTEAVTEAIPTEADEHPLPEVDMGGMPFPVGDGIPLFCSTEKF